MARLRLQTLSILQGLFADLGIVGSDKQDFRPEVPESVQPVYTVNPANVTNNVTQFGDSWTTGGKAFTAWGSVAAQGAGQFGMLQIANPAASGKDLMIDSIITVPNTAAATCTLKFGTPAVGGGGFSLSSKDLQGAPGASVAVCNSGSSAAPGGTTFTQTPLRTLQPIVPPLRIPPGGSLTLVDGVANEQFQCGIEWREVPHV